MEKQYDLVVFGASGFTGQLICEYLSGHSDIKNINWFLILAFKKLSVYDEPKINFHQRNYSESYWDKKVFAPSALLFYIGLNKKVRNLEHHNLFFDVNFDEHASAIYNNKKWPDAPQFYVTVSSITDLKSTPENCDSFVILIPISNFISNFNI